MWAAKTAWSSSYLRSYLEVAGDVPVHRIGFMKTTKVLLGIGAACAACCAIPLLGGSAAVAAVASGVFACADEFVVPAFVAGGIALATGALWWRNRRLQRAVACGCTNADAAQGPDHG